VMTIPEPFLMVGALSYRRTVLFVYSICIRIIKFLIQDTCITFSRPCEAVRQIEDDVLYLWMVSNKKLCQFTFFHADTKTDHKSPIQW
jgi:hypothetical protein